MDKIRVLAVDDNPAILKYLSDSLSQKAGIEMVGCACDGAEGLAMAQQLRPDVMLLDVIMPKMDGFEVLGKLREWADAPRVVMVTGLSRDDFIARAMALGAGYYMIKPVEPDILYRRVLDVVSLSETPSAVRRSIGASADERVTNLFLTLGIPAHIKGYSYLREAVGMVLDDRDLLGRITKELYPGIARRYATSASKVERAMRHAIEVAWNRGRLDSVNHLYGCRVFAPEDKPTNGEFIAMIADKVTA